jgi:fluoride exporter
MPDYLYGLLWVAVGSIFGGSARFFLSGLIGRIFGDTFPWATLTVNVTGCLAIGVLASAADGHVLITPVWWQLAVVGFLGTYTTVSSFSLQTLMLVRGGEIRHAGGYVLLSVTLCLAAAALGLGAGAAVIGASAP